MPLIRKYQTAGKVGEPNVKTPPAKNFPTDPDGNRIYAGVSENSREVRSTEYSDSNAYKDQAKDVNTRNLPDIAATRTGTVSQYDDIANYTPVYNKERTNSDGTVVPADTVISRSGAIKDKFDRNNAYIGMSRRAVAKEYGHMNDQPVTVSYTRPDGTQYTRTWAAGETGDYNKFPTDFVMDKTKTYGEGHKDAGKPIYGGRDMQRMSEAQSWNNDLTYKEGYNVKQTHGGQEQAGSGSSIMDQEYGYRVATGKTVKPKTKGKLVDSDVKRRANVYSEQKQTAAPTFKRGGKVKCSCSDKSQLMKKGGCIHKKGSLLKKK